MPSFLAHSEESFFFDRCNTLAASLHLENHKYISHAGKSLQAPGIAKQKPCCLIWRCFSKCSGLIILPSCAQNYNHQGLSVKQRYQFIHSEIISTQSRLPPIVVIILVEIVGEEELNLARRRAEYIILSMQYWFGVRLAKLQFHLLNKL